jgi:hypothetical protein
MTSGRGRLAGLALALAGLTAVPAAAALACEAPPGFDAQGRLQSAGVVVLFRTRPATIEVGRHFSVEAVVCAGAPARGLRVDAAMPEHRHGMNYRARVTAAGDGRYVAEGLLLHMPGRWQLVFDVERDGGTERLATDIVLQ